MKRYFFDLTGESDEEETRPQPRISYLNPTNNNIIDLISDEEEVPRNKKEKKKKLNIPISNGFRSPEDLISHGIYVFPFYENYIPTNEFWETIRNAPELEGVEPPYVAGSFGALAFTSLQRSKLAFSIYEKVRHKFPKRLFPNKMLEIIPDRFCIRYKGTSQSAETLHRDTADEKSKDIHPAPGDMIYGGWINFSQEEIQYYEVIPGTISFKNTGRGFDTSTDLGNHTDEDLIKVSIPPGYAILFNQTLIHRVSTAKIKCDSHSLRVFIGARVSDRVLNPQPLISNIVGRFMDGESIPLKSGQEPRVWPALWGSNWIDKYLEPYSDKFNNDAMRDSKYTILDKETKQRVVKYSKKSGKPIISYKAPKYRRLEEAYKPFAEKHFLPRSTSDSEEEL